jgi:thioredoxin-related protein
MKLLSLALLFVLNSSFSPGETEFARVKEKAAAEHKFILLNFSGSDWCVPCIKMHHDIFEDKEFISFSDKTLVLFNADFPRQKKNLLPKPRQLQNDQLADQYNSSGIFPLTVLLNSDGKVLKTWEGYPKTTVEEFIAAIKQTMNDAR